jgi:hypothetical protein
MWRPCRDANAFITEPGIALRDDAGLGKCDPCGIVVTRVVLSTTVQNLTQPAAVLIVPIVSASWKTQPGRAAVEWPPVQAKPEPGVATQYRLKP